MAINAAESLGGAIGLQGAPKDYSFKFYEMGQRADANKAKKEAAAAEKEAKELERLSKLFKVDLNGYLPKRAEVAKKRTAEFTKLMADKRALGVDVTSDPEVMTAYNNLTIDLNNYKKEKEDIAKDILTYKEKPDAFDFDKNYQTYLTMDMSEEAPIYVAGAGLKNKVDYNKYMKDVATSVKQVEIGTPTSRGQIVEKQFDPEITKKEAEYFVASGIRGDNLAAAKWVKEQKDMFDSMPINQNKLNTPQYEEELGQFLIDKTFEKFTGFQDYSKKENQRAQTNVNVNTGAAPSKGDITGSGSKVRWTKVLDEKGGTYKDDKQITSIDGFTFPSVQITGTLPVGTIDTNTGKPVKETSTQNLQLGELQLEWVYKDIPESRKYGLVGNSITDEYIEEAIKRGQAEPKILAFGYYTKKDSDGKEKEIKVKMDADKILKNINQLAGSEKDSEKVSNFYKQLEAKKQELINQQQPKQGGQTKKIKVGDVVNGYKFKGGDTKDSKNWEKI